MAYCRFCSLDRLFILGWFYFSVGLQTAESFNKKVGLFCGVRMAHQRLAPSVGTPDRRSPQPACGLHSINPTRQQRSDCSRTLNGCRRREYAHSRLRRLRRRDQPRTEQRTATPCNGELTRAASPQRPHSPTFCILRHTDHNPPVICSK